MGILCLWGIQLTFDWVGIKTHGAYPHKSGLKRCKGVEEFFRSNINICKVNANGHFIIVIWIKTPTAGIQDVLLLRS